MLELSLQLLLAHLAGDFLLQSNKWVSHKRLNKEKSPYLYAHAAIHLMLMLMLTQFESRFWVAILLIAVSHLLIDLGKLYLESSRNKIAIFFADQLLHLLVIATAVYAFEPYVIDWDVLYAPQNLLLACALLGATFVTSIVLKVILSRWSPTTATSGSIESAGKYIGILERLFIFYFVVMNLWEGIGFLLAAKSVFRFGDLTRTKDLRLTEYILIGTLLSFGFGILCASLYKYFCLQL